MTHTHTEVENNCINLINFDEFDKILSPNHDEFAVFYRLAFDGAAMIDRSVVDYLRLGSLIHFVVWWRLALSRRFVSSTEMYRVGI